MPKSAKEKWLRRLFDAQDFFRNKELEKLMDEGDGKKRIPDEMLEGLFAAGDSHAAYEEIMRKIKTQV